MMRRLWFGLLCVVLIFGLSGCGSSVPVDERALVLILGFAPGQGNTIRMLFQIPTSTELTSVTSGTNSSGKQFYTVEATGATPGRAFAKAQTMVGQDLYLGQVQLIAFSSKLSAAQMAQVQDWLNRLGTMDNSAYVAATSSVDRLFERQPAAQIPPAVYIYDTFSCPRCSAVDFQQRQWTLETQLANDLAPDHSMWMPWIEANQSGFRIANVVVYRHFQPAIVLTRAQTVDLGYLMGRTKKGDLMITWRNHTIGIRSIVASSHYRIRWQSGRMHIFLTMHFVGTLEEAVDMQLHADTVKSVEHLAAQKLGAQVLSTLVLLQQHGTNPVDYGERYAWWHPETVSRQVMRQAYAHADITVSTRVQITNTGAVT
ncbi:Ger(x)C family spore germination C-terminal domain-containing protein [Sulfobacillus harzensis]|uniref:Ger(X)C family spore germination protein n=1 Tax=Sulfobacillus harzensis TaxID=2729629 RepID=A0A7Y0L5Q0_9FIRM|nr:Ger(x)C family spore germination C-terminal domain-containing protein [Sulfobacillus harzensis]NMP23721.1 hypothetical protein [Sulfobacillus harzensis]